jgi:hypothetical protein
MNKYGLQYINHIVRFVHIESVKIRSSSMKDYYFFFFNDEEYFKARGPLESIPVE